MVKNNGGHYCIVKSCRNIKEKNPGKSFFRFPADKHRKAAWIEALKLTPDVYVRPSTLVCSDHFHNGDILSSGERMRLSAIAIPFVNSLAESSLSRTEARGVGHDDDVSISTSEPDSTLANLNPQLQPTQFSLRKPWKYCVVPQCRNVKGRCTGKHFFAFPIEGDSRRPIWCEILQINETNVQSPQSIICSDHFDADKDLTLGKRVTLKKEAIPSKFLPPNKQQQLICEPGNNNTTSTYLPDSAASKGGQSLARTLKRCNLFCQIPGCPSSSVSEKKPQYTFFKFPADQTRKEEWCNILHINPSSVIDDCSYLCSLHFSNDQFAKIILKKNALPTTDPVYSVPRKESVPFTEGTTNLESPGKVLVPNLVASTSKSSTRPSSMNNPYVLLNRIESTTTTSFKKPSQEIQHEEEVPSTAVELQQLLLNTKKVISVLKSRKPKQRCLLCAEKVRALLPNSDLMHSFRIIFNATGTFDQDSFVTCKNCTSQLELLVRYNKKLQTVTRQFENVRTQLMKIMIQNYVRKTRTGTGFDADGEDSSKDKNEEDEHDAFVDHWAEDWRVNLEYEKLIQETKNAYTQLNLRKSKQLKQQFRRVPNGNNCTKREQQEIPATEVEEIKGFQFGSEEYDMEGTQDEYLPCDATAAEDAQSIKEEEEEEADYNNKVVCGDDVEMYEEPADFTLEYEDDAPNDEEASQSLAQEGKSQIDHATTTTTCPTKPSTRYLSRQIDAAQEELELRSACDGNFQCRFCEKLFERRADCTQHEKWRHLLLNNKIYHCQFCGRINRGLGTMVQHYLHTYLNKEGQKSDGDMSVAYGDSFTFYACDASDCLHCFFTQDLLSQHIEKTHGQLFTCMQCKHVFAEPAHLESHLDKIHPEEEEEGPSNVKHFPCEYCHMNFPTKKILEYHNQVHTIVLEPYEYKCSICNKEYRTIFSLNHHKSQKHKIKKPGTKDRQLKLSQENYVKVKMPGKSHTKIACKVCKKQFFTVKEFRVHREIAHDPNNPNFPCEICGQVFSTYLDILRHSRKVHAKKCRFCDKEFDRTLQRKVVKRRMHEYACNPVQYLANRPFLCKVCLLCFETEPNLEFHHKFAHEPCKCKICGTQMLNSQGLTIHLKSYCAGKPSRTPKIQRDRVACEECNITFVKPADFTAHNLIFHNPTPNEEPVKIAVSASLLSGEQWRTVDHLRIQPQLKCQYNCKEDLVFVRISLQRRHYVECHATDYLKDGQVYCNLCYKVFKDTAELEEHSKGHVDKLLQCEHCGKQFQTRINLVNHKYIHLKEHEGFCCEICGKVFQQPIPLKVHLKTHFGKSKQQKSKLKPPSYKRPRLKCIYDCEWTFCNAYLRRRHYALSHAELYYEKDNLAYCGKCYKLFQDEATLTEHLKEPHREKKKKAKEHNSTIAMPDVPPSPASDEEMGLQLQCEDCGKQFTNTRNLNDHKYIHLVNHEGFSCEICGKIFKRPNTFKQHLKSHSLEGKKPNLQRGDCKYCGKNLCRGKPMNRHLYIEHREEYLKDKPHCCNKICYAAFGTQQRLDEHFKTHFKCQFCELRFESNFKRSEHENSHTGNKPYECKVCGKCFSADTNLRIHRKIHTGEKPFNCELCSAGFMRKKFLIQHQTKIHPRE